MSRDARELAELADLLGAASVRARPHPYATSCSLDELEVVGSDGAASTLLLKDCARSRMLADARRSRPAFLDDPTREIDVYRRVLAPNGLGPRLHATVSDGARQQWWLVCERVDGVALWQVGDIAVWEGVARWLASMHRDFLDRVDGLLAGGARLLRFDATWFERWAARARTSLSCCPDDRAPELLRGLDGYDRHVDALASKPATFVHGELYPSNVVVVVDAAPVRVCPVDWEMAGVGPALLDLAALVSGWDPCVATRLVTAYGAVDDADLLRCRLHLALQWIGWSPTWIPPAAHAHDWLGEALALTRELA